MGTVLQLPCLLNLPRSYWQRDSRDISESLGVASARVQSYGFVPLVSSTHSKIEQRLYFLVRVIEPSETGRIRYFPVRFESFSTIQLEASAAVLHSTWSLPCAATSTLHQNVSSKKINQRWQQSQIGHMFSCETSCWHELLQRFSPFICSTFCSVEILKWRQRTRFRICISSLTWTDKDNLFHSITNESNQNMDHLRTQRKHSLPLRYDGPHPNNLHTN